jgi:hypothetical protein
MRFVIGSEKMQKFAKHGAREIGFWWASFAFAWRCEVIPGQFVRREMSHIELQEGARARKNA